MPLEMSDVEWRSLCHLSGSTELAPDAQALCFSSFTAGIESISDAMQLSPSWFSSLLSVRTLSLHILLLLHNELSK
jgi:hypothetical protein